MIDRILGNKREPNWSQNPAAVILVKLKGGRLVFEYEGKTTDTPIPTDTVPVLIGLFCDEERHLVGYEVRAHPSMERRSS